MKNEGKIILNVNSVEDIKLITKDTKYINLNINNIDKDIIKYFIANGSNYSYCEMINNQVGYIYIDYETFLRGENIITDIIVNIPKELNDLEKSKYLYITLGKILGYDINILPDKNDNFSFYNLNIINNIWGSITNCKGTNSSFCKLYYYLCHLVNIDCEIIKVNDMGYLCNKLLIGSNTLIVDLTKDFPFIQSRFKTRYFANYNDDILLDKKINYIKDEYSEIKIDNILKNIDYMKESFLFELLIKTQDILKVSEIKPIELGIIYDYIFHKYCPNYQITINNLYLNNIYNNKEHFILISYHDEHYSYNYKNNSFVLVENNVLLNSIQNKKIGLYLNEQSFFLNNKIMI